MKSLLANPYAVFVTRVFIGLLFIVSSLEKIVDPTAFTQSIVSYKLLPASISVVIATVLPWLELLCGFAVLFGVFLRGSSLLLSLMIATFTIAVVTALVRGLDISCGCFTQDPSNGKIGWMKVVQDVTLLALTVFLYYSSSVKFSIEHYLRNRKTAGETKPPSIPK